jgi:hypothetical protein
MESLKRIAPSALLTIGVVLLVIGFVQQGYTLSVESGFFTVGVILTVSGFVAFLVREKS